MHLVRVVRVPQLTTGVRDSDAVLRVHPKLHTMLLARNRLGSSGVAALVGATGLLGQSISPLRVLDLTDNGVRCHAARQWECVHHTVAAGPVLCVLSQLEWPGMVALAAALRHDSCHLRVLKLCSNTGLEAGRSDDSDSKVEDTSTAASVASALAASRNLKELWLDDCDLSAEFLQALW